MNNSPLGMKNVKASYIKESDASAIALPQFPELAAVLTIEEAVIIYNVTVYEIYHDVVINAVVPSRQSGKTWIIRVVDALARWGDRA